MIDLYATSPVVLGRLARESGEREAALELVRLVEAGDAATQGRRLIAPRLPLRQLCRCLLQGAGRLGRRFGLLPANRGVVSTGPFRLIRHPIDAAKIMHSRQPDVK